ncbi:hypothetical protein IW261DRAFT_1463661 [Armillaria novae-zelandiae]|uniref:Fe2OG dioxygenase domain-containing protein n=1 Tax=Armillaria novae-zelandiae TaxID=153914 RepID=A0AA39UI19_9AGAR|nr:hypothetical protein IW261DRAFT_1463661 [Armillaria novae-zelandiae]
MAKKSKTQEKSTKQTKQSTASSSSSEGIVLLNVTVSPKRHLECRVLLENQILLIDNFLSTPECKAIAQFIDDLPLELTPPKRRGEAVRVNYRFSVTSPDFAQRLHDLLVPHLPLFLPPAPDKRSGSVLPPREPHSFNSNIRFYKYTPSQHFGPHYDDSVRDPITGAKSEWTLLIYLSGVEDGVQGGETIFYKDEKCRPDETTIAPLNRGTALLHRHGQDCLLHEGSEVAKGTKYVLRSDLMFKP